MKNESGIPFLLVIIGGVLVIFMFFSIVTMSGAAQSMTSLKGVSPQRENNDLSIGTQVPGALINLPSSVIGATNSLNTNKTTINQAQENENINC